MKRVVLCKGFPYFADQLEDDRGWFIWSIKPGSEVYHTTTNGCTCPAPKPCKHMEALQCVNCENSAKG